MLIKKPVDGNMVIVRFFKKCYRGKEMIKIIKKPISRPMVRIPV